MNALVNAGGWAVLCYIVYLIYKEAVEMNDKTDTALKKVNLD